MVGTKRVSARTPSSSKKPAKKKVKYVYNPTPRAGTMSLRPNIRKVFPASFKHRATLRYFGNFASVNPGIGGTAASVCYSANGLADPDITGAGHQPIGFDQYMALYQNFTVIGAKIHCYFENGDNENAQFVFVTCRNSSANEPDTREVVENGYLNMKLMSARTKDRYIAECGTSVDIAKYLGLSNIMDEDDAQGDALNNPQRQVYFLVGAFPTTSTDSGVVYVNVVIEYDVVFHERKVTLNS